MGVGGERLILARPNCASSICGYVLFKRATSLVYQVSPSEDSFCSIIFISTEKTLLLRKVLAKIPVKTSKGYEEAVRKLRDFRKAAEYAFLARLDAHMKELVQLLDIQQIGLDGGRNADGFEDDNSSSNSSNSSSVDSLSDNDDMDDDESDTWLESDDRHRRSPVVLYVPPPLNTRRHAREATARRKVDPIDRYLERLSQSRRRERNTGSRRRAGGGGGGTDLWDNLFGLK